MTRTAPTADDCDEHEEGCLCGTGHRVLDHEATADEQLPAATGRLQGDHEPPRQPAPAGRRGRGLANLGEL